MHSKNVLVDPNLHFLMKKNVVSEKFHTPLMLFPEGIYNLEKRQIKGKKHFILTFTDVELIHSDVN